MKAISRAAVVGMGLCLSGCASTMSTYNRGYDRGASDTAKRQYWILQNMQKAEEKPVTPKVRYYAVPAPTTTPTPQGDIRLVPHDTVIPVIE
jgi:hypothetical protein